MLITLNQPFSALLIYWKGHDAWLKIVPEKFQFWQGFPVRPEEGSARQSRATLLEW